MKALTLVLLSTSLIVSCKSKNLMLKNAPKEYWEVFSIKGCYRVKDVNPIRFERWILKQDTYDLYKFYRDGSIHPASRSGRDYGVEQTWQLRNDSILLDGDLRKYAVHKITDDSLILYRNATCIAYKGTEVMPYQTEEIFSIIRKKGYPLE